MSKDFEGWNTVKQIIEARSIAPADLPTFSEREIWWCSIGINIGHEEDGKNEFFNRPVLIVKKFNSHLFWGIPLTTQIKEKHYYHKFSFYNRNQCAIMSQLRLLESRRLGEKMGKVGSGTFREIKEKLRSMI